MRSVYSPTGMLLVFVHGIVTFVSIVVGYSLSSEYAWFVVLPILPWVVFEHLLSDSLGWYVFFIALTGLLLYFSGWGFEYGVEKVIHKIHEARGRRISQR